MMFGEEVSAKAKPAKVVVKALPVMAIKDQFQLAGGLLAWLIAGKAYSVRAKPKAALAR